jgi:transposase
MSKNKSDLTNNQWKAIAHLFPDRKGPGRPFSSVRLLVNGVLWYYYKQPSWRDLPQRFGPWQTIHSNYNKWNKDGRLKALLLLLERPEVALST